MQSFLDTYERTQHLETRTSASGQWIRSRTRANALAAADEHRWQPILQEISNYILIRVMPTHPHGTWLCIYWLLCKELVHLHVVVKTGWLFKTCKQMNYETIWFCQKIWGFETLPLRPSAVCQFWVQPLLQCSTMGNPCLCCSSLSQSLSSWRMIFFLLTLPAKAGHECTRGWSESLPTSIFYGPGCLQVLTIFYFTVLLLV